MKKLKKNYYPELNRGQYALSKLTDYFSLLPNDIVSDIGAGWGWLGLDILKLGLIWQPFDNIKKIDESRLWDLNNPCPKESKKAGFVILLEVLEHLSNPELGVRNIAEHMELDGLAVISTPNPHFVKSKWSYLLNNQLYAFQPKHLREHHVYVPLPHIVVFHLENSGFELVEFAILGKLKRPRVNFSLRFISELIYYYILITTSLLKLGDLGGTQVFFVRKKYDKHD